MKIRTRTQTAGVESRSESNAESWGVGASWMSCPRNPPLHAIVHELRDALRSQRDHLDDMLIIFCKLETALLRLATEGGSFQRNTNSILAP